MFRVIHGGIGISHHDGAEIQHHRIPRAAFAANIGHRTPNQHGIKTPRPKPRRQIG